MSHYESCNRIQRAKITSIAEQYAPVITSGNMIFQDVYRRQACRDTMTVVNLHHPRILLDLSKTMKDYLSQIHTSKLWQCGDTLPSAGYFIVHGLVVPSITTYMLTSSSERLQNTKGKAAYQVTFVQRKK